MLRGKSRCLRNGGKSLPASQSPLRCSQYLVDKGCIAVDGCSLTVCDAQGESFAIWLIPHTLAKTNLTERKPGDFLNLEFDLLAKYVEKLAMSSLEKKGL